MSIDGLRPDLVLRAETPVMHDLMTRGSYSLWAQTTDMAVTLPSHVSMLTGVPPSEHRVTWNDARPHPSYPEFPTLFELARKAGYTTAMAAGKSKFAALAKPGTLTWSYVPDSSITPDDQVTSIAAGWIERSAPQVLMVHLPEADATGHEYGWGSERQLKTIGGADRCIGRLLEALGRRGLRDSTLILVTADHGGAGKTHGPGDPRSRMIPWIAAGAGVRANGDLTTLHPELQIHTEDTFATICAALGIRPPRRIQGRVIDAIFLGAPAVTTKQ